MNEPATVIQIRTSCSTTGCSRPVTDFKSRQLCNACGKRAVRNERNLEVRKLRQENTWLKKRFDEQVQIIAELRNEILLNGDLQKRIRTLEGALDEIIRSAETGLRHRGGIYELGR